MSRGATAFDIFWRGSPPVDAVTASLALQRVESTSRAFLQSQIKRTDQREYRVIPKRPPRFPVTPYSAIVELAAEQSAPLQSRSAGREKGLPFVDSLPTPTFLSRASKCN